MAEGISPKDLQEILSASVADSDLFLIFDISAGVLKKISKAELFEIVTTHLQRVASSSAWVSRSDVQSAIQLAIGAPGLGDAATRNVGAGPGEVAAGDHGHAGVYVSLSALGETVAPLVDGQLPADYLPGFVDYVLEFADLSAFPTPGERGKIYIDLSNDQEYRWSGSAYRPLSKSPGTTDAVPEGTVHLYFTPERARAAVADIPGKADSADKLAVVRLIAGEPFDGTKDIAISYLKLTDLPPSVNSDPVDFRDLQTRGI